MAIQWSGWYATVGSQQWRIGIDIWWDGANTAYYDVWIDALYPVSDTQTVYYTHGNVTYNLTTSAETKIVSGASFWVGRGGYYEVSAYLDRNTVYTNGRPYSNPTATVGISIPAAPPSAPTISSFSNITSSNIRVNATIPESNGATITNYAFKYSLNPDMSGAWTSYNNGNIHDIGGLTRATKYYFQVSAYNSAGWGAWSAVGDATTLATVPAPYPAPAVSSITSTGATVAFGASPDDGGVAITNKQLQIATNSTFTNLVYDNTTTAASVAVSGLTIATTYYVRTRPYNSVGWGNWSPLSQFTTSAVPPSQPVAPSVGSITQDSASATWSAPSSGGSTITSYDIQIATNSDFTAGLVTTNVTTLSKNFTELTPGTNYWVRVRANNAIGSGPYSTATAFTTVSGKPSVASSTNFPVPSRTNGKAGAAVYAQGWSGDFTITVNIATNDTFSAGLVTLTSTPTTRTDSTYELSNSNLQANGTYYVRAKVKNNTTLYESEWSDTVSYTQSHAPTATTVSPKGDTWIKYAATTAFTFLFTDSAQGLDQMSAYRIVVENNSTGAVVYDSNKTALSAPETTITRSVAISAAQKNIKLRWKVMGWDANDQPSSYSSYALFTLGDAPAITMMAPGATVESGNPLFEWSATFPSGGIQASALLNVYEQGTGSLVWTKSVSGTETSAQPSQVVLQNGSSYNYVLRVTDTYGLFAEYNGAFTVSYQAPDAITYEVDATEEQLRDYGYVLIDWSRTAPDSRLDSWVVYRKELPYGDWVQLADLQDIGLREYHDWTALGNKTYQYTVSQKADRSGVILESPVGYYIPGGIGTPVPDPRTFTIVLSGYWLIFEDDESSSLKLHQVTGDSFSEEYESATYTVMGRGRRRDYGTRLGYTGTLELHLRGANAHESRLALQAVRRRQDRYYLKTPFGEMFPVALGDPSVSILPATGTTEMSDVSIPYEEVF